MIHAAPNSRHFRVLSKNALIKHERIGNAERKARDPKTLRYSGAVYLVRIADGRTAVADRVQVLNALIELTLVDLDGHDFGGNPQCLHACLEDGLGHGEVAVIAEDGDSS